MRKETSDSTPRPALAAHPLSAREIVACLRTEEPALDVFDAFWELDRLPADEVREALAPWVGPDPDPHRFDAAWRLVHGTPSRPLRLRTLSTAKDADVLDLGPVAEEQLRLAGISWDDADRAPEDRLDGELEGSFAGTLERRVLGDADAPDAPPLFDVLLFAEDAGVVFAAGTTKILALIAYRRVEMRDRRTRLALEQAITVSPEVAPLPRAAPESQAISALAEEPKALRVPPSAAIVEERVTSPEERAADAELEKKAVVKEAAAKSRVVKSRVVEAPAKKPLAKKAVAKKIAAKKSVAKKAAAKKSAAKKPPAKKSAAKKPAAKKPAAKKPAAKKARVASAARKKKKG